VPQHLRCPFQLLAEVIFPPRTERQVRACTHGAAAEAPGSAIGRPLEDVGDVMCQAALSGSPL
jgi:hypothetical protein